MLKLAIPTESFWVDCPHGVRLLCRPLTTALNHAAVARAGRLIREAASVVPEDADLLSGARQAEALFALGTVLIEAWEGVATPDGAIAARVTPENVRTLLSIPEIAAAFNAGISRPVALLAAEGNA